MSLETGNRRLAPGNWIPYECGLKPFRRNCAKAGDQHIIELLDDRHDYGEERYVLIGMSDSRVLVIAYTEREARRRIISARKAEPNERRYYYDENA